jgi:hypothetical protein
MIWIRIAGAALLVLLGTGLLTRITRQCRSPAEEPATIGARQTLGWRVCGCQ